MDENPQFTVVNEEFSDEADATIVLLTQLCGLHNKIAFR